MDATFVFAAAAVAISLYVFAAVRLGLCIARGASVAAADAKLSVALAGAALCLHAACLYHAVVFAQGVNLNFFNMLSVLGWVIAAVLLAAALFAPVLNLGVAIFPGAAVALALMMVLPSREVMALPAGWPMRAHVVSSVLAYSVLAIAAAQVILLGIQDRALRRHKTGRYLRALPPLQTMEALLFQMVGLGFVALSFSLLTGALYITDLMAQHLAHKTVFSLLAWAVFAVLLWGRQRAGWRGKKALLCTLGGFAALGLAYPVTKFILEIVLQR